MALSGFTHGEKGAYSMGPTSFTGIVYEASIEMGYFLIGAHPSRGCGTAGLGPQDPTTTSDPSEPVDTSDPSGTTDPADPSNTGTACESNDDCAPGICGEDGTCQPRDLACFSDADCFDDEYCAFHQEHPMTLPWLARVHRHVPGPKSVHLVKNVSMDVALVTTVRSSCQ